MEFSWFIILNFIPSSGHKERAIDINQQPFLIQTLY